MKRFAVALVGAVLMLGTVQAGSTWKVLSKGVTRGEVVSISLSGDAKFPSALKFKATASPNQKVDVSWSVFCSDADFNSGHKSKSFEATTPVKRKLPIPIDNPVNCSVRVHVINDDGKLWLKVFRR